jgi:tRNA modification GTPase
VRDTIAAIATPPGSGGVGIVRLSGPMAAQILETLIGRPAPPDRQFVHGMAREPASGERLDEVLAVVMRAPRSYTGEDVAEIHGHGGALNLARLLRAALSAGARAAEPGEFTRRAFENGRLDLTRAEAVVSVIGAASERALRAAQATLGGGLAARVGALRASVLDLLAEVEASVDFPEEDLDFVPAGELARRAGELSGALFALARTYTVGRALGEGIEVALTGPPNVGKSSLLNALVGEERALVAAEPGTTRDYVEARVVWSGVPVTLIDTAGEREAVGLEARGVELGRARAARADCVVVVRDATVGGAAAGAAAASPAGRWLEVWNKIDVAPAPVGAVGVSALMGTGLELVRARILAQVLGAAGGGDGDEGVLVSTERQRALVEASASALERVREAALAGRAAEILALELREAAQRLGQITGDEVTEPVLDRLFARFCIGK